jgi:hypothetical protein
MKHFLIAFFVTINLHNWQAISEYANILDIKSPNKELSMAIDKATDPIDMIDDVKRHLSRYNEYPTIKKEIDHLLMIVVIESIDNQRLLLELLSSI